MGRGLLRSPLSPWRLYAADVHTPRHICTGGSLPPYPRWGNDILGTLSGGWKKGGWIFLQKNKKKPKGGCFSANFIVCYCVGWF